jgi:uncharacterized protein
MPTKHLKDRLEHDLKDAMRARDQIRLLTIRSLIAAILNREKEGGATLSEDDLTAVVQKQAKQRRDSIEQFEGAGREELAQRERDELAIIERYLPAQLSDDDIRRVIHEIIVRSGATSRKDLGRVMGEAMSELRGRADGNRVRIAAQGLLNE